MGGRFQTRWGREAKERRLLLILARVLSFIQLGVVGSCWIVNSKLGILDRAILLKRAFCKLLSFGAHITPSRMCRGQ